MRFSVYLGGLGSSNLTVWLLAFVGGVKTCFEFAPKKARTPFATLDEIVAYPGEHRGHVLLPGEGAQSVEKLSARSTSGPTQ